ncbi:MAG: SIMPL domain-containing protein [Albidovulum sp.]
MRILNVIATVLAMSLPVLAAAETPMPMISVSGEGRVEIAPDMATVSLGVTNEADTATSALSANSEAVASVLERLAKAGVEARDIQTSGLSLGPRYDYNSSGGAPKLTGYVASNTVTVRVRALETTGNILDLVVAGGANTLNGLSFGLQNDQTARDEARTRAVADAARKAELYAKAAGVTLGPILSIREAGSDPAPIPMMMAEASFAKGGDVPVSGGELDIRAGITIVYRLQE